MCRIAGIVDKKMAVERQEELVTEMCQVLRNGGPDDQGIYSSKEDRLVLGNRRLALIDLSDLGHQPMSYCGRYYITYNGELYNFPELKEELLKKNFSFHSTSDTEVILASFAAWGTDAFAKFNGMFAFALFDKKESALYLVRDASGIKPLYYSVSSDRLVFASEIKALKRIPGLQEENRNWPVYLMAYGHLPEPVTTLRGVQPLSKGSYLKYKIHEGKWNIGTYSSFHYSEAISDRVEVIEKIREGLGKAVQRHLISDAPIGVFLSGGIDSSVIALLANKYHKKLNTLSLYFSEGEYSEKKYQDLLQQNLNCSTYQHLLSRSEFDSCFPAIIGDMDMPGTDGLNTWFISKYARKAGLKAVLSGVGGDELFGGYPSFSRIGMAEKMQKLPKAILKAGALAGIKKLRRSCYLGLEGAKGKYLFLRGHFIPSEISKQLNIEEKEVWDILEQQPESGNIDGLSLKNQASWIEMNLYMQNQLLRDSDVMSMAHGVEIRVPFLDKEFITYALQINTEVKYAGKHKKQLLIDSFKDILPESIWNRPKMGFSFPFKEWMAKNEFVKETMERSGKSAVSGYTKFLAGNMHWSQLMTLVLLQKNAHA